MRELKGDVGYEKDLGRELQRKRREQKAHNEEKEWQLAKSKDLVIAMPADCQARPKLHALRNADWDNEDTTDTTTTNYDDYEPKTLTKITTITTSKAGIEAGNAQIDPSHRQLPVHLNLMTSTFSKPTMIQLDTPFTICIRIPSINILKSILQRTASNTHHDTTYGEGCSQCINHAGSHTILDY